jgi:hypothetical protein
VKLSNRVSVFAAAALLVALPAAGSAQTWTTWNAATPGEFDGTLLGTAVTFLGSYAGGQLSGVGIDYFSPTDPYTQGGLTAPDAGGNVGFIKFVEPTTATITFSTPMTDLYLAFISVGQLAVGVTYTFDHPFNVLSNNNCPTPTYWGCGSYTTSGNSITGHEFSGTIQFLGTFDELTLTTDAPEDWHGITVGADAVAPPTLGTPEPATFALLGTGLAGLAGVGRLRRKRAA